MKRYCILYIWLIVCVIFPPSQCLAGNPHADQILLKAKTSLEKNEYNEALNHFLEYVKIEEKENKKDTLNLINAYKNIGGIYSVYQNFAQALDLYEKAYALCQGGLYHQVKFQVLNNMIGANCNLGKWQEAENLNKQIVKMPGVDKGERLFYYYFNNGFIANHTNDCNEKVKWMSLANEVVDKYQLPLKMKAYPYSEMYQCYEKQGELTKALDVLLIYDSLAHLVNRTKSPENRGQAYLIADCYKGLMRIYTKLGDKEKALFYQNAYFDYNDSILNVNEFSKIRNEYQTYENQQTQETITSQQKTIFYQKLLLIMLVVLVATAVAAIVVIRRQQKTLHDTNVALFDRTNELVEAKSHVEANMESKADSDELHQELLHKIIQVMSDVNVFCDPEFSLPILARLAQSNTNYVSQTINSKLNKNFRTFVNEYRIKEAMARMKNNDMYCNYNIQGISESVGFKSVSNFIAAFKKYTGMTPSLYQKLSKNG